MANKKLMIASAGVTTLALGGLVGLSTVSAASSSGTTLADKLASTFHLNKADVQKVIDQDRSEHQAQREQNYEQRLSQAVTDGKITAAQKDLILAKHKELLAQMESERDSFKNLSETERKAKMDQKRTELEQWAKDNGLSTDQLHLVMGMRVMHGGPGGPGPDGDGPAPQ